MKYNRISPRNVLLAIAIAVAIYWIATCTTSKYSVEDQGFPIGADPAAEKPAANGAEEQESAPNCEMKAGTGLASPYSQKKLRLRKILVNLHQKHKNLHKVYQIHLALQNLKWFNY